MGGFHVEVDGAELWVEQGGPPGAVPLLFVHGFSFDRRSWAPQVAHFGLRHRIVTYDLGGFGRSRLVGDAPVDHVRQLDCLIRKLDIQRPVLVGLSLGANVALSYALAHPGVTCGLLLASPGLPGHVWRSERPSDVAGEIARAHGLGPARDYWLGHRMFAPLADHPEARAAVHAMVAGYDGLHWLQPGRVAPLPPATERLGELALPVHVVGGGRDLDEYRLIARKIAAGVPGGRHVAIPDAGHVVNLERPAAFDAALEGLLADVMGAAPIAFDLDEPGTFVYSGPVSTRGLLLNRFALSLKRPENRAAFLADEAAYVGRFGLGAEVTALILARDWTGLLRAGGHLQAILKLAATVGQSLWHIGAHNAGVTPAAMMSLCPRRVSKLPDTPLGASK